MGAPKVCPSVKGYLSSSEAGVGGRVEALGQRLQGLLLIICTMYYNLDLKKCSYIGAEIGEYSRADKGITGA